MPAPISLGNQIKRIAGLAHTSDVDAKTSEFIDSVVDRSDNGTKTSLLSEKQVTWVEDIHRKHFGDAS